MCKAFRDWDEFFVCVYILKCLHSESFMDLKENSFRNGGLNAWKM